MADNIQPQLLKLTYGTWVVAENVLSVICYARGKTELVKVDGKLVDKYTPTVQIKTTKDELSWDFTDLKIACDWADQIADMVNNAAKAKVIEAQKLKPVEESNEHTGSIPDG